MNWGGKGVEDKSKKIIYIVADKNCMQYARILETLISEKANMSCTVFDKINVFEQNKLSSENLVVFIGKNRLSSPIIDYISKKYDQYGIHYGWRGTRAVIWRESIFFDNKKTIQLINAYNEKYTQLKKMSQAKYNVKKGLVDALVLIAGGPIGISGKYIIQNIIRGNKLRDAQYKLGLMEFYTNSLESFIGVASNE